MIPSTARRPGRFGSLSRAVGSTRVLEACTGLGVLAQLRDRSALTAAELAAALALDLASTKLLLGALGELGVVVRSDDERWSLVGTAEEIELVTRGWDDLAEFLRSGHPRVPRR